MPMVCIQPSENAIFHPFNTAASVSAAQGRSRPDAQCLLFSLARNDWEKFGLTLGTSPEDRHGAVGLHGQDEKVIAALADSIRAALLESLSK
jgi:hypothetical protein